MKLHATPEFDTFDCLLIHQWLGLRGWEKDISHPFRYIKPVQEDEVVTGEVAHNLFDALKVELQADLDKE